MVFAFLCETIPTGKITIMGNVQAQRLHHRLTVPEFTYILLVDVICIQHTCFF